jgi:hypothetical protein
MNKQITQKAIIVAVDFLVMLSVLLLYLQWTDHQLCNWEAAGVLFAGGCISTIITRLLSGLLGWNKPNV